MTLPATYIRDAVLLEAIEDILCDEGVMEALVYQLNTDRGSDPELSPIAAEAVEVCPVGLDLDMPPQSYPAVRVDVVDTEEVYGVNNGAARVRSTVEVRVFSTTADRIGSLAASGKRTTMTTASIRGRLHARVCQAALQKYLVGREVNGVDAGIYNVVNPTRFDTQGFSEAGAFMLVTTFTLDVWQKARSLRFDFDTGELIEDYILPLGPTAYWQGQDEADGDLMDNLGTGSDSAYLAYAAPTGIEDGELDDALVQGARWVLPVRNGEGGPGINGFNDFGNTGDRTIEFLVTLLDKDQEGSIFRSFRDGSEAGMGELSINSSGGLVYTDPEGTDHTIFSNLSGADLTKPVFFHLTYDATAEEFKARARLYVNAIARYFTYTQTVAYTNVDSDTVRTGWDGDGNNHTDFNLHHAAIYNTVVSSAHRDAVYARAGMD